MSQIGTGWFTKIDSFKGSVAILKYFPMRAPSPQPSQPPPFDEMCFLFN